MAGATYDQDALRILGSCGLVRQVHPRLQLHHRTSHQAPQGGVWLVVGGGHNFLGTQGSLVNGLVLHMPNFSKSFIAKCDASGFGFGVMLHQGDRPIAFFSMPIAPHHAKLATYERERIGLVQAVQHWRPYLWGHPFVVHMDHYSLKYLMGQGLSTIPQDHWVSKIFGFDFSMEFRLGHLNTIVDTLSRWDSMADELPPSRLPTSTSSLTFVKRWPPTLSSPPLLPKLQTARLAYHGASWMVSSHLLVGSTSHRLHHTCQPSW